MMRTFGCYAIATSYGATVALLTYSFILFFGRNVVDGLGPVIETGAAIAIAIGAIAVGSSSARSFLRVNL